ncbi:MAG: DUF5665 domain-containing protein [Bacillota bacterium]|nr:DUF5665 domain-containing protein [Bacillota bacterium]
MADPGAERAGTLTGLERTGERLERLVKSLEQMRIAEYVQTLQNVKRLLLLNFISGLARGFGMAVGFSILGALLIYLLTDTFVANLPIVGDFIAQLVKIVQTHLTR